MCLKNAFRKMCITICGRFCSNKGVIASYGKQILAKYIAKWGEHYQHNHAENSTIAGLNKIYRKVGRADYGNDFSNTL